MKPAPIALFVYNRPEHTRRTIQALKMNVLAPESELFVFSDGAKESEDALPVKAVREYVRSITGFNHVHITERAQNLGLARNIMDGVTDIVNRFGTVIVLEDDMVTSPYFLQYMNDALDAYRGDEEVISIHGYSYPTKKTLPETFFLRGADCWGWATWKRGWDLFESDGTKLLDELEKRNLTREFDFGGSYGYTAMLYGQTVGKNDSWAVRWYASAFLKDKLTLYPGRTLVQNIGLDGSGRHSGRSERYGDAPVAEPVNVTHILCKENIAARKAFALYFRSLKPGLFLRIARTIRRRGKKLKHAVHEFIPPILLQYIRRKERRYGFFGIYSSWKVARKSSSGYDTPVIADKVKESSLKVKRGEAAYERDSVTMEHIEYSWHILAPLLWAASRNGNRLRVLDFGGGLGTTYQQNRIFLSHLAELRWGIVEQPTFVRHGNEHFSDDVLSFHDSITDYYRDNVADVVILSSSLQYIEQPYAALNAIVEHHPQYILFDKTPFQQTEQDIITVQKVPKHIYDASYPSWVFSRKKFLIFMSGQYDKLADFNHYRQVIFRLPGFDVEWSGYLYERK